MKNPDLQPNDAIRMQPDHNDLPAKFGPQQTATPCANDGTHSLLESVCRPDPSLHVAASRCGWQVRTKKQVSSKPLCIGCRIATDQFIQIASKPAQPLRSSREPACQRWLKS